MADSLVEIFSRIPELERTGPRAVCKLWHEAVTATLDRRANVRHCISSRRLLSALGRLRREHIGEIINAGYYVLAIHMLDSPKPVRPRVTWKVFVDLRKFRRRPRAVELAAAICRRHTNYAGTVDWAKAFRAGRAADVKFLFRPKHLPRALITISMSLAQVPDASTRRLSYEDFPFAVQIVETIGKISLAEFNSIAMFSQEIGIAILRRRDAVHNSVRRDILSNRIQYSEEIAHAAGSTFPLVNTFCAVGALIGAIMLILAIFAR